MPRKVCQREIITSTLEKLKNKRLKKINLIWLEACGCSGNIISLLDAATPDVYYVLSEMVNMTYNNSTMGAEGQRAFDKFLETLDTEFILVVEGAVSSKDAGIYNIVANYNGKSISGAEAVTLAAGKAKYILAVGTCASYGGISAANPNPSSSKSVIEFLSNQSYQTIRIPGCPANPRWVISTIAHLISFGLPQLDSEYRPLFLYEETIHTHCSRRSYFDKKIFAKQLGDKECMYQLGCRGPITRSDCALRKWNDRVNWPVEDNTPCIGCVNKGFPDDMEPFINFQSGEKL
ncbi:hydrogenase small subunit [Clostridium fungisolvens]|uniref:Periplasmic [NiFeSe] hydrogenase small subunit n=1 Tax=Clostridium fungisolvens TaxID=1604897 RepID=A0A6V8SBE8_9CLOT|nr:hydrogenase small subunit [Clostridium fungisolvens]GFP74559.1 Periplasmic [NiFeSe] hydrogenase small subunit [Clostridium fungisolvens]